MKELPTVFVELPACNGCGCVAFDIDKTISDQGDGSKLQYANCRACGLRQKIVYEIPLGGKPYQPASRISA